MKYLQDVHDFQDKFKLPQPSTPRELNEEDFRFRYDFMVEELTEYIDARAEGNLEKQLDSLVDLVYVALGTALWHGFDFDAAWDRVHKANMEKHAGLPTGRHGSLDVSKPPGWTAPVLADLVSPDHVRTAP
jgi:predicted HAD superfamily Cof-like phosphohydrolase